MTAALQYIMEQELITTADAAKILNISERTVTTWCDQELIKTHSVTAGGHRRFLKTDIVSYAEQPKKDQGINKNYRIREYAVSEFLSKAVFDFYGHKDIGICTLSDWQSITESSKPAFNGNIRTWMPIPHITPERYRKDGAVGMGFDFCLNELEKADAPPKYPNLLCTGGALWEGAKEKQRWYFCTEGLIEKVFGDYFRLEHKWYAHTVYIVLKDKAFEVNNV